MDQSTAPSAKDLIGDRLVCDEISRGGAFYVYLHRRPGSPRPFYVGKGRGRRAAAAAGRGAHWWSIVRKYGGFDVEIVECFDAEEESFAHERFLIASFLAVGVALANKTAGGDGVSGHRHSPETRKMLSEFAKGKPVSEEARRKMSITRTGIRNPAFGDGSRGKPKTEETRKKISDSHLKMSPETRLKITGAARAKFSKEVLCVDTGSYFSSLVVAVSWLRENGHPKASASAICECANSDRRMAYGYVWRYPEREERKVLI